MLELSWTRLMLAAACLLATTTACVVGDVGLEETGVWQCTVGENDCIDGQECIVGADGQGYCQEPIVVVPCPDNDGDGFNAPTNGDPATCPDGTVVDCNDANININPDATEVCNGDDDNCDGTADEGVMATACTLTEGVCAGVMAMCIDGAPENCAANCPGPDCAYGANYVVEEAGDLCGDGLDNDCDGITDSDPECPTCMDGDPCMGVGCGANVPDAQCACSGTGTKVCEAGGESCVDGNGDPLPFPFQTVTDICGNGIDDNCNGAVDEAGCMQP